jgi:hypothetical protein
MLHDKPQNAPNVALLQVEGGVPFAALQNGGRALVGRRDITCDSSVMQETAELSRCDGVMDRIASILTFSIRLRPSPSPRLRRTRSFGDGLARACRQTHGKRIPNAFRTDEMAGNCENNGYNGLRNISNFCSAQKGLARHRKNSTLAPSRHLHWSHEL